MKNAIYDALLKKYLFRTNRKTVCFSKVLNFVPKEDQMIYQNKKQDENLGNIGI